MGWKGAGKDGAGGGARAGGGGAGEGYEGEEIGMKTSGQSMKWGKLRKKMKGICSYCRFALGARLGLAGIGRLKFRCED